MMTITRPGDVAYDSGHDEVYHGDDDDDDAGAGDDEEDKGDEDDDDDACPGFFWYLDSSDISQALAIRMLG